MIDSLTALQNYLLADHEKASTLVEKMACNFASVKIDEQELKDISDFPASYLNVIKNYNVHYVEYAGFSF